MLKKQKPYLIICLLVSSLMIFAVNTYANIPITEYTGYVRILATLFLFTSIITLIFYRIRKNIKTYRTSLVVLLIFLVLNLILVREVVLFEYHQYEMSKFDEINTCEKATIQFNEDLKTGKLKYFMFGLWSDEELFDIIEDKYDIQMYHMGCIVISSLECYNALVENHFEKKYNMDFWDYLGYESLNIQHDSIK